MLKRKIYEKLVHWKHSHGTECLLVCGARQVGKSFVVTEFGRTEYEHFVSIDFVENPELKDIFSGSLSAKSIYSRMTLLLPGVELVPGKTLIFLDEIQECPEARSAFKYLAQDGSFDVIGSGSLLGIRFSAAEHAPSLPVGYERQITMHPLDFEEFLWARGYSSDAVHLLKGYLDRMEAIPQTVHQTMMRYLREYLAIGGMPAVVQAFAERGDFGAAHDTQVMLHTLYLDDIAKYAPSNDQVKARACYLSLPAQLAKENTRFKYSVVEKRSSARKYEGSIDWICGANMTLKSTCVSTPQFPLASYEQTDRFRLYANDTGLLMAMFDFSMKQAVVDNTLTGPMKGGLYENLIAGMLAQKDIPLRYWMSQNSKYEIEFLVEQNAAVSPVEVKASKGSTTSLNNMLERDDVQVGYKLIDGNIGRDEKKITLPLYMALFLFDGKH